MKNKRGGWFVQGISADEVNIKHVVVVAVVTICITPKYRQ